MLPYILKTVWWTNVIIRKLDLCNAKIYHIKCMWVSDLHFMVGSWFFFYLKEYLMDECCTGDIDSVWHKHWTETVSQWPIFHDPVILPYTLKTIWWTNVIIGILDPCDDLRHKMYVCQWPTFHGPVILSYILKTIWWINVVLEILIQCDTNIEPKLYM